MITMTYDQLNSMALRTALGRLTTTPMPIKLAYRANKIANKIDQEVKIARKFYVDLLKEYCEKNDKGELAFENNKPKIPTEKQAEYEKKMADFMSHKIEINWPGFKLAELGNAAFSAQELDALGEIIDSEDNPDGPEPVSNVVPIRPPAAA